MRIVLNGVETFNKGAELMLYAILQEIERRFPDATVFLPSDNIYQGHSYIKTSLDFRPLPHHRIFNFIKKTRLVGILNRLHLPNLFLTDSRIVNDVDYYIDGSGFAFSDQYKHTRRNYDTWRYRLEGYAGQGTKIIFLPQAFGPVEEYWTKRLISLLFDKSHLIYAREKISYDYLIGTGCETSKLKMCTDFTSLVEGIVPQRYSHLSGRVAIIPNLRMVDRGATDMKSYLKSMSVLIETIHNSGHDVYLLNHEWEGDEKLCHIISKDVGGDIPVVSGLNALEVKGLISTAYLCVTSRFHGLASALNSCVPCLATGWSHKYEELYRDYDVDGCMLDVNAHDDMRRRVSRLLDETNNKNMREHLKARQPAIQNAARRMWDEIWSI